MTNRPMLSRGFTQLTTLGLIITSGALLSMGSVGDQPSNDLPATMTLTGVVRDFRWATETNGHADYEYQPTGGYAHYAGMVADTLDADGKPVFASTGYKVNTEAHDAAGNNIMPVKKSYMTAKTGDTNSSISTTTGGASHTSAQFAQWFRDTPNVNVSKTVPLTLVRQGTTNTYTFNDKTDDTYKTLGGFFPINKDLYGNSPSQSKNFGFSFELDTNFVYKKGTGQIFTFTGDDDVWVFVDGKLVVDIGGVHGATSQTIDLDRLNWLVDNKKYELKLFFAERHTTESNVRIDTTLTLETAPLPATTGLSD